MGQAGNAGTVDVNEAGGFSNLELQPLGDTIWGNHGHIENPYMVARLVP